MDLEQSKQKGEPIPGGRRKAFILASFGLFLFLLVIVLPVGYIVFFEDFDDPDYHVDPGDVIVFSYDGVYSATYGRKYIVVTPTINCVEGCFRHDDIFYAFYTAYCTYTFKNTPMPEWSCEFQRDAAPIPCIHKYDVICEHTRVIDELGNSNFRPKTATCALYYSILFDSNVCRALDPRAFSW